MASTQPLTVSEAIFQASDAVPKLPPHINAQLDELAKSWGISRIFRERMAFLYGREFIFLFDDSGLNSYINFRSMRNTDAGSRESRWLELKSFAAQAIALSSAFDMNGVDVYFLNRPTVSNVKSIAQLEDVFRKEPTDYCLTPLSNKLDQIINEKRELFASGTGVLVIATDGNNIY
jgi:hypothetical protein